MRALLLDDPIGSLSHLEEKFNNKGIETVRVWDVVEAGNKFSTEHFDGVIASTISILGDAIDFCLTSKKEADSPLMTCIYSPYPINDDDKSFLKSLGNDLIFSSDNDGNMVSEIQELLESGEIGTSNVAEEYDRQKVMKIIKASYEASLKDLASKALKLEEILENASDVIYELDPYGRIILISKVIEKLTGYSRDELIGMSALDVTSADSLEVVADHISMLLTGNVDPPAVEVGVQCKNGHVIPAEMIVRPIRHRNQVVGILGIGRNVEERKRLEESIRRVINEKDFYLDLMSHDLQNFNTAIVGYLEMILASEGLDPKVERFAKGAFRQVMQTAQLIAHIKRVAYIRKLASGNKEK
ncbi:MAG: PAS domain S-box protein, partial [Thermoplasmata archaeon]|nr:PAS domain S-box protein [Thermoplasmata archaeon]